MSAVLLAAVAASALLLATLVAMPLMRRNALDKRFHARVASVSHPHMRAGRGAGTARPVPRTASGLMGRLALSSEGRRRLGSLFGFSLDRLDQYPVSPWLVVAVALPLAWGGASYLASLTGDWGRLLALPGWLLLTRRYFSGRHRRHSGRLYQQLPDALGMIVRAVRAGLPVAEAVRTVGRETAEPTGGEFRRLADQLAIGVAFDVALRTLARRSGLPEYGFFAVALALQNQAGGNLTETLENLADVIRKRVAMRQRGVALASQAKSSAYILGGVPVFASGALALLNPGYISLLFTDARGNLILAAAVGSLVTGMVVMRTIIRRSLS